MSDPFPVDRVFGLSTPASPWGVPSKTRADTRTSKVDSATSMLPIRLATIFAHGTDEITPASCPMFREDRCSNKTTKQLWGSPIVISIRKRKEKKREEKRMCFNSPHASYGFGMESPRIPASAVVLLRVQARAYLLFPCSAQGSGNTPCWCCIENPSTLWKYFTTPLILLCFSCQLVLTKTCPFSF